MCEEIVSYLVKHSDLGAKDLNKICVKIVQKLLRGSLQYVNFQKIFGSIIPDPLEPFLFSICFKIILHEKNKLENMANLGAPSLRKILEFVPDMKTFSKGFLGLFWV